MDQPIEGNNEEHTMQIRLASILVDDQKKALAYYTNVLGFVKKVDLPMGPFRWLTVASPEGVEGVELVLEPLSLPRARAYQEARFVSGIPATAFITNDIETEYERLKDRGVIFRGEPVRTGKVKAVVFEDTCGNLINLLQPSLFSID